MRVLCLRIWDVITSAASDHCTAGENRRPDFRFLFYWRSSTSSTQRLNSSWLSVMKDEIGQDEEHERFTRQELFQDYKSFYLQLGSEVRPCQHPGFLKKTAQFLLKNSDPRDTFTVFPFYQAVTEKCGEATDCRKHLAAFIKATEMLEIICINMFLQPWKKEIRSLKVCSLMSYE